jgi:HEAT repeat protein
MAKCRFTLVKRITKIEIVGLFAFVSLSAYGYSQEPDVNGIIQGVKYRTSYYGDIIDRLVKIGKPAVEPLIVALDDENYDVKAAAVQALGKIRDVRALEPLAAFLRKSNSSINENAAMALGHLKDGRAVVPLVAAAKSGNVSWGNVCQALTEIGSPAVESLMAVFKEDSNAHVRKEAIHALGLIEDNRAIDLMIAALRDVDAGVQYDAADALRRQNTSDPRISKALLSGLKERNLNIIAGADTFFIRMGKPGTEDLLIQALNKYQYPNMMEDFLNSGNVKLSSAAYDLARQKGYYVRQGGGRGPRWGKNP